MDYQTRTVADLQQLPETEPIFMYNEVGLARCTKTCRESCGFTCGQGSCTHTVGVVQEPEPVVSEEQLTRAQAGEGAKW
jgi:hypothetical protein